MYLQRRVMSLCGLMFLSHRWRRARRGQPVRNHLSLLYRQLLQEHQSGLLFLAQSPCCLPVHRCAAGRVLVRQVDSLDGQHDGIGGTPSQMLLPRLGLPGGEDVDQTHHALVLGNAHQFVQRVLPLLDHLVEERDGDGALLGRRPSSLGHATARLDVVATELASEIAEQLSSEAISRLRSELLPLTTISRVIANLRHS